jgi:hypothetical protein
VGRSNPPGTPFTAIRKQPFGPSVAARAAIFGKIRGDSFEERRPGARGSHMTHRWRGESTANSSLKWGFPGAWRKSSIPGGLWMITVGRNAILGSYSLEIVFLSLSAFSRHYRRKLLKVLTVSGARDLPAGEFTVYKKSRPDHSFALIQLKT